MRRALIAVWLALAITAIVSCTRVVDLDGADARVPDASTVPDDGGLDGSGIDDASLDDGGGLDDGGSFPDGAIGDASLPDAL